MVYLEQLVYPKTHCLALCVAQVGDTLSPFYYLLFLPISKILARAHPTGPQKHSIVSTLSHSLVLHLSKWWPYTASGQSFWSLQAGLGPVKEGQDELEPRDRTPERPKWLRLWCGAGQAQHWLGMEWRWPEQGPMKTLCTASWIYAKLRLCLKYKIAKKFLVKCRITDIQIHGNGEWNGGH